MRFQRVRSFSCFAFAVVFVLFSGEVCQAGLYEVLGITPQASPTDIRQAYRNLAKKIHPDVNPNDPAAPAKFIELQHAYEVLRDPQRRARYDQNGDSSDVNLNERESRQRQEYSQQRAEEYDRQRADEIGEKYSNPRWPYDRTTRRFYDNRTSNWLHWSDGNFISSRGWLFYPHSGRYYSVGLAAYWNPEDPRGWYRNVSNSNLDSISIDPNTGFTLSTNYHPRTVSDVSDLFDAVLNPVNVLDAQAGRIDRESLLRRLSNLAWSDQQRADFVERSIAHIRIFKQQDMQPRFNTDVIYTNAFMDAILGNDKALDYSEIIVEFVRGLEPRNFERLANNFLTQEKWINHPNAANWLRELPRTEYGARVFSAAIEAATAAAANRRSEASSAIGSCRRIFH